MIYQNGGNKNPHRCSKITHFLQFLGGKIKTYETVDWRTGEKKLVKSNELDPQWGDHQTTMYYLQNNDLTKYENLRGFINNTNLVYRESISTDFYIGDENNPLYPERGEGI